MKNTLTALAIVLCFTACGKSHLTTAQKQVLSDTMTSVGRTTSAVPTATPAEANLASGLNAVGDSSVRNMNDRLTSSESSHDCSISVSQPAPSSTEIASSMHVTGTSCPIALSLDVSGSTQISGSSGTASIQIKMDYMVNDSTYLTYNDVDQISLAGGIDFSGGSSSASADIQMHGQVHSQAQGAVKFDMSGHIEGSQDSAKGDVTMNLTFPDFSAELKMEMDGQNMKYSINGEEVSATEFNGYVNSAGSSFNLGTHHMNLGSNTASAPADMPAMPNHS